ncbi:MAG TPA: lysylphosphatidylglycerol synthase transmembrane domain-containing protein [Kofleriaceae bacterium]|nr:lysylphosphatidylglycerol synthase transmembrane domain-containing protein [Kofleriaceae bacterium]
MNRRLAIALRVVAIIAVVAALWWFVREMDVAALGNALRTAKLWPLLVAAVLNFLCLLGKAACWRILLAPRHRVSVTRLFRYTVAAFAASALAPARAGEVLRVWTLKRRDGVPAPDTAAVAVAEKLLDGISMLILVAPVPWLLPGLPSWVAGAIALCGAIAIALFAALFIAVRRVARDSGAPGGAAARPGVIRRFIAGMHALRSPGRVLGSVGVLMLTWAFDLGEVTAVLYAVGIDLPIAAGLLILFTLNLTIMVPSTPAGVGALEVGAIVALDLLHVGHEPALAFALLYHGLQVIPIIVVGLILELRLVLGREAGEAGEAGAAAPHAALDSDST